MWCEGGGELDPDRDLAMLTAADGGRSLRSNISNDEVICLGSLANQAQSNREARMPRLEVPLHVSCLQNLVRRGLLISRR